MNAYGAANVLDTPQETYGQINHMWAFADDITTTATNGIWADAYTKLVHTGVHLGKGMVGSMLLAGNAAITTSAATTIDATTGLLTDAITGVSKIFSTSRIRKIDPPTGGIMQFKGLVNNTVIEQYV